jgi:hypothetical protein
MSLVAMPTGKPNPYEDIQPADALKLLIGMLDRGQWTALTGPNGLRVNDLKSDAQRQLFAAVIAPGGKLIVSPTRAANEPDRFMDLTQRVPLSRLRLGQIVRTYVALPAQAGGSVGSVSPVLPGKYYHASASGDGSLNRLFGVSVRSETANAPKVGQLDFSLAQLAKSVSLNDTPTVGRLFERLRTATGVELYADARYAARSLTTRGAKEAPAADVLRAVAFCLTGTYRKVGPAYVLTDDLVGIGAKREAWRRFQATAEESIREAMGETDRQLERDLPLDNIARDASSTGLTPGQAADAARTPSGFGLARLETTFGKLTPAQQEEARRAAKSLDHSGNEVELGPDSSVSLVSHANVEVIVPGLDAPASMFGLATFIEDYARRRRGLDRLAADGKGQESPTPAPPAMKEALAKFRLRAALIDLASVADGAVFGTLRRLGFGSVWIHVPVHSFSQEAPVIQRAIADARKADLEPYVLLDPFLQERAAAGVVDRTILMEKVNQDDRVSLRDSDRIWLSPAKTAVVSGLTKIVQWVAAQPGLAGIALRRTSSPGYEIPEDTFFVTGQPYLGYSAEARLAFLREKGADPVDLAPYHPFVIRANTSLPSFDDPTGEIERALAADWAGWRTKANRQALAQVLSVALAGRSPALPVFVQQRRYPIGGDWYGLVATAASLLPGARVKGEPIEGQPGSSEPSVEWARRYSQYIVGALRPPAKATGAQVATSIVELQRKFPSDGILIDLTNLAGPGISAAEALRSLLPLE